MSFGMTLKLVRAARKANRENQSAVRPVLYPTVAKPPGVVIKEARPIDDRIPLVVDAMRHKTHYPEFPARR
ncbi:MAG: hypothetical protein OEQ29_09380 [Alphaproteobacteria bacterium]|nr:hypothetical protein [Alphaproteobacteria bacterium]